MKKIKILPAITLGALLVLASCQDQSLEDINRNPNDPERVFSSGLMNSATKELMDATRNGFESGRMSLPWIQYSAQVAYTEEDRFQFRETSSQALYSNLYKVILDFKSIIDLNTDPSRIVEMKQYGDTQNQIATARIMLAYSFSILADTFGPVPYWSYGNKDADFQGLNLEKYPMPLYASQEKIYTDILKELKEASQQLNTSEPGLAGDVIYNRDVLKWRKFANSLRLRIANRLKDAIPGANAHIQDAIASGLMASNSDNAVQKYQNDKLLPSPMFNSVFVQNRTDFKITNTMVNTLKGLLGGFSLDPRLFKYAAPVYRVDNNDNYIIDPNSNDKVKVAIDPNQAAFEYTNSSRLDNYVGLPYGLTRTMVARQDAAGTSWWSNNIIKADFGEVLMEYSEVQFILSEINGWSDTNYKAAVRASMEKWNVPASSINTFVNSLPAANKANVLNQKWVALYMQPQEAYAEWRRTGYPNFLIKPGDVNNLVIPAVDGATTYAFIPISPSDYTLTEMPSRITYPVTLAKLNPSGYASGVKNLGPGGDKLNTKLIWDKN
ncbi:SusD/RagB family nutrient-binding outer membrane lipoprotein [Elizabethkingia miricola]|uniref:SusD/RagB family nutrient-binding outer membrane lipoprotein n=2 Tax=Elizabethkingia miricola TaxID=172045 RepID=A0ABD5B9I4_ELIMR|nr:SusD/RagB family nutrient-binding outer membrane lipoprotein [Elizabethkingia miricola]MDQ8750506.1 SusD/RagB family nutrient-binding outer membrane lipoprotein [Elizabethkingia miricola]NHQ68011.1 SusD/RagB family nutrient-binding outer membrane lipoprotein [Elizabethkingia miricola]NHQ72560.1 SusD/RagB family nutrient-binding outer membrane lipoprotein [Elizabethkingia miricola]NHQ78627.1 SusD/RagB family nutrient-binding outer membrane lipoprotein [Elizabethkingia miricola]PSL88957.1 Sus